MDRSDTELFCLADRTFFDLPDRVDDAAERFAAVDRPVPTGWTRSSTGLWSVLLPDAVDLPDQGWKVHVAGGPDTAAKIIDAALEICLEQGVGVKFLRSALAVRVMNSKSAPRGSSGKVVTAYPVDDEQLTALVRALDARLGGTPAPYILSDLRIGAGPVYVRYGGFRGLECYDSGGALVPAVRRPDGVLVPDERTPFFNPPSWAAPSEVVRTELAKATAAEDELPYEVTEAISFSNGGGVYRAKDPRTGAAVVLREARPHAGVDDHGHDAVQRLRTERTILERLAGLDCVPAVLDYVTAWEHEFLVEEFIEGRPLMVEMLERHPLALSGTTADRRAGYVDWLDDVLARVRAALERVHERGVIWGDVHPANVLVRPDGSVVLIDFEAAGLISDDHRQGLAASGFNAPAHVTGVDRDWFAVDRTTLFGLVPNGPSLTALAPTTGPRMAAAVAADLDLTPALQAALTRAVATTVTDDVPPEQLFAAGDPGDPRLVTALAEGILANAQPGHGDRLFPGAAEAFAPGQAVGLAYGAAGVLHALSVAGVDVPGDYTAWLAESAVRAARRRPDGGLYTGAAGAAWVLAELGAHDAATEVAGLVAATPPRAAGLGVGRAGHAWLALQRPESTDRALHDAAQLAAELTAGQLALPVAGLLEGGSGLAVLFVRAYERTGDPGLLDAARLAIDLDLEHCNDRAGIAVFLLANNKNIAHLAGGSGGVAVAIGEYLRHREDDSLGPVHAAILAGLKPDRAVEPGLFEGRAGLVAMYARFRPDDADVVRRQVRALGEHAVEHRGHLLFPGRLARRLSTDLATGSAGVLLALHALQTGRLDLPGLIADHPTRTTQSTDHGRG